MFEVSTSSSSESADGDFYSKLDLKFGKEKNVNDLENLIKHEKRWNGSVRDILRSISLG